MTEPLPTTAAAIAIVQAEIERYDKRIADELRKRRKLVKVRAYLRKLKGVQ